MEENINALDELNKGACMGVDSIHFIIEKIESSEFRKTLEEQSNKYKGITKKINEIYPKYNKDDTPHDTNPITKAMTWSGIEMRTMTDSSDSKIAELLSKGTNMGIIEGRRIINNKKIDKEVKSIAEEYISIGEESIENIKKYL